MTIQQDEDEDKEYDDGHSDNTDNERNELKVSKGKRQKGKSSGQGNLSGDSHKTLTPRQMAALHWANRDFNTAATDISRAAVEKEQNEKAEANLLIGGDKHEGVGVKARKESGKLLTGKLRNGKKRDVGRRLACN
jgi:hypothetical protein